MDGTIKRQGARQGLSGSLAARAIGRLRYLAALAPVLAAVLLLPLASAPALIGDQLLPDLVSDPPTGATLQVYDYGDGKDHLLLRFNGFVHNSGDGPLEMHGDQRSGSEMTHTFQRIFQEGLGYSDYTGRNPRIIFETNDSHDHWHLKNVARYSLWNQAKTAEVAPSMKAGFCLEDSDRIESNGPTSAAYNRDTIHSCEIGRPQADSVFSGVSAGWRDNYNKNLAFQWVDVSDVQPGVYYLRAQIDPDDVVREASESNNGGGFASSSTIPGYIAKPTVADPSAVNQPVTVTLGSDKFGSPGSRRFRIESAPAHGTLDRAVGEKFSGPTVTYSPDPWYRGADSFTFSALDSTSQFPRQPAVATASVSVDGSAPSVAIGGAPQSVVAGTSAQLLATVVGDDPKVTWSVNHWPGGGALTGTISSTGLYVAPASVPIGGSVEIEATSSRGGHAEVTLKILPASPQRPAPAPGTRSPAKAGGGLRASMLTGSQVTRHGRLLLVSVRPKRAGVVRIKALKAKQRLDSCRGRVSKGRRLSCRLVLPPHEHSSQLRIVVSLRVKGKLIAVHHSGVPRPRRAAHHH